MKPSFAIDDPEKKLLAKLEEWLEKRRMKYRHYFNEHQEDMYHQEKFGELIQILDKINDLKKRFQIGPYEKKRKRGEHY